MNTACKPLKLTANTWEQEQAKSDRPPNPIAKYHPAPGPTAGPIPLQHHALLHGGKKVHGAAKGPTPPPYLPHFQEKQVGRVGVPKSPAQPNAGGQTTAP